ncbi:MAG TPA: hypothetical protein VF169_16930 [Albitalea sp.]|uniref:HzsA-related protein n=1 Tax=Piscinibacter sp. TaxID=1903157 RepID=UPI002ED1F108
MTMKHFGGMGALACAVAALAAVTAGCGSGSASDSTTVTVNGDVPVAYVMRASSIGANPTNAAPTAEGGDLMIREKSSASAPEHNITARFTQGHGDASDPEVSYDGKKIVFAMRCPTSNTSTLADGTTPACTGRWNIWEYDMTSGLTSGTFKRLTSSTTDDDVDPAYLPAGGGFVFTSNRQTKSKAQALGRTYFALDEYERERVMNLHTMDAQGANITQISVNQSHDRNPTVRPNGDIMFSRWDHVAGRNHFKIFRAKPDGTDMFVLYGSHSEGNSFLHPRDMDPAGKYKGFVSSDLMPLSGTDEGGGLVFVDAQNYSEQNTPANKTIQAQGGQTYITSQQLNIGRGLSQYGRVTTPYPLWDGTDRVLVGFRPCEVTRDGKVVSCATLTDAEKTRLGDRDRLVAEVQADSLQDNVPPNYAIYMYDPGQQTWLIVAAPPPGFMYTDPIALQPRTEPNATPPTSVDATLAASNMGLLEVRSVYDTDGLGRMGDPVLGAIDLGAGCTTAIAKRTPQDAGDTRDLVADIARMKDPADAAYKCAPARFVRAVRAVAPPSSMMGLRSAIGETEFEMQQILGYAPIEPDGSFKLQVPADTPIALAIIDAKGRAFQTHTNWIQVRPGERRTCDGCHSPRRGGAINSGSVVNSVPAAMLPAMAAEHRSGETLAATRTRLFPTMLSLQPDPVTTDVWADTSQPNVTARTAIALRYNNGVPAESLGTPAPTNGIINYPDHIAPLWTRDRGANTCTTCHNDSVKLDLRGTTAGTGRLTSYEELLVGDPVIDGNTGLPVVRIREGVPEVERGAALVDTGASEGDVIGLTRKSRLGEIMFGENMMAGADARTTHPNPPAGAPNHATMLNAAEKRLIAEWMDMGGQYFNDPFNAASQVRSINGLSQTAFNTQVFPILRSTCANGCHQAVGSGTAAGAPAVGTNFRNNRFVLTGDPEGDFGVTLSMISNACTPASNYLLSRPSTVPHPSGALTQGTAVLPPGSANYNTIAAWIQGGC